MPQLLSLSRAARLVGVTRGALQKKIKSGELSTFEGRVSLSDLLRAYPEAEVRMEADSMLERVEQIKDNALTKVAPNRVILPDAQVLATRVTSLSQELAEAKAQLGQYSSLIESLKQRLGELTKAQDGALRQDINSLITWLFHELQEQPPASEFPAKLLMKDSFLRVMAAHIRILPSNHEFFLEGSDTILEAALRAGLALNYGCSNGNCGLCKAKIISGEIKKVRPYDYAIGAAEKAQGYALLCSHTAVTDLLIEASEAGSASDIPLQQIATRVKKSERLTDDIVLLHLQTPRTKRLRFLAGQHAALEVTGGLTDSFPIASCPCDDRNLQFHVQKMPDNPFSDYVFTRLKNTDVVSLEGPKGEFVLQEDSPRSIIFLAYDTGFAPIKSLVEHAMALDVAELMHLYWIAEEKRHYMHNLCRSWTDALDNFSYTPLTLAADHKLANDARQHEPSYGDGVMEQCLTHVVSDHRDLGDFDIYVAGLEPAANAAEFFFLEHGVPATQLFIERLR